MPDGDPYPPPTTPGLSVWAWIKTLTPGKRLARVDITRGHDGPYPRIHIKNSVGCADAVLPNPSGWAIGLNRSFGSVCSVLKNFGLRKTTTDRWTSKTETDVFGFRFNWLGVRFPPNFSICPCRSSAPSTLAHVSPTSQEPMKINTCVGVACHHRSSKWVGA